MEIFFLTQRIKSWIGASSMGNIPEADVTPPARQLDVTLLAPFRYLARKEHFLGPPSTSLRVKFFLTGCFFPAGCIALILANGEPSGGQWWQSGNLDVYVALLLSWKAQIVFLPLVAYNVIALGCWIFRPTTIRYLAIRFGVYSGIPLAAQYLFLLTVATYGITLICSAIVAPLLALVVFLVSISYRSSRARLFLQIVLPPLLLLIIFALVMSEGLLIFLIAIPFIAAIGAPALSFITFIRASIMIAHEHQRRFGRERRSLLGWLLAFQALAATWFAGWKIAVDVMLLEYAKLPTTPPKCYLSAAAQHRHAWLFREPTTGVSLQTKRLKFLEIALRCAAPRFHAMLRRIYDHLGPPLANFCGRSPWFADITYIAIVPLERLALLIRRQAGVSIHSIDNLYARVEVGCDGQLENNNSSNNNRSIAPSIGDGKG